MKTYASECAGIREENYYGNYTNKVVPRNDLDGRSSMKLKGDSLERNRSHIVQTANRRSSTSGKIIVQIHNARCM